MSLFGALGTASSGIAAQAAAFSNISDDVANSQSTGFKRVDTSFEDFLTTSNATVNNSGAVVAIPDYVNTIEGTVSQTDNPLGLAVKGQGFFSISNPGIGSATGAQTFDPTQAYTRDGNFQLDKQGYLVNDVGQFLNGWTVANGVIERNAVAPILVSQASFLPVPTTTATLAANLPPNNGTATTPYTTQCNVFDAQGQSHQLNLTFTPTVGTANSWGLTVTDDGQAPGEGGTASTIGSSTVTFNADGTLAGGSPVALTTQYPAETPAGSTQQISLSLGTAGRSDGLTQDAADTYTQSSLTQNGIPPGTYSSTTFDTAGDVKVNYSNGQSTIVARVPVVTFDAPDQLQRQNGQSFTATTLSGSPQAHDAGTGGAGGLATSSLEASNVDIGSEFTQLIVAQNAYSANTKVVTTSNAMLQATLNMVQ